MWNKVVIEYIIIFLDIFSNSKLNAVKYLCLCVHNLPCIHIQKYIHICEFPFILRVNCYILLIVIYELGVIL